MHTIVKFNKGYFGLAAALFFIEVGIALFVHDDFIRPYFGDVLVVVLIYTFVKSFLETPVIATAIVVLLFSYTIEVLQYFDLIVFLHLENNRLAKCVLGNSFEWVDFIAYTVGILLVISAEKCIAQYNRRQRNRTEQ